MPNFMELTYLFFYGFFGIFAPGPDVFHPKRVGFNPSDNVAVSALYGQGYVSRKRLHSHVIIFTFSHETTGF